MLKRLFDGGVTLVPGTDDFGDDVPGLTYHGELETYQRAWIPAASVLQIATIVPARVMGEERDYGSIAPGKVADLVIVDGRPDQDIRDLRRAEWVMRAGRAYRTVDLYRAAGLTPTRVVRAPSVSRLPTAELPTRLEDTTAPPWKHDPRPTSAAITAAGSHDAALHLRRRLHARTHAGHDWRAPRDGIPRARAATKLAPAS